MSKDHGGDCKPDEQHDVPWCATHDKPWRVCKPAPSPPDEQRHQLKREVYTGLGRYPHLDPGPYQPDIAGVKERLIERIRDMEKRLDTYGDGMRVFNEEIASHSLVEAAQLFREVLVSEKADTHHIANLVRKLNEAQATCERLMEPTPEMIDAGLAVTAAWLEIEGSALTVNREKMRRRYKAMVARAALGRGE